MILGMIKYHLLLLVREPLILVFGLALPFVQLFLTGEIMEGLPYAYDHAIDVMMPMFLTIAIMALCFMDSAFSHAYSRQIKFLRRLRMTPVKPATYILTGILSRLGVVLVYTFAFFFVSTTIFGLNLSGRNWFTFAIILLLLFSMFYFIGMFVANVFKDAKQSQSMLYIVFFGFIFLINVIGMLHTFPTVVREIIQNSPVIYSFDLLHMAWMDLGLFRSYELFVVLGLTGAFGFLSIKFFKFE